MSIIVSVRIVRRLFSPTVLGALFFFGATGAPPSSAVAVGAGAPGSSGDAAYGDCGPPGGAAVVVLPNAQWLNVRATPGGTILTAVRHGREVSIAGACEGAEGTATASQSALGGPVWCEIDAPVSGCVSARYLDLTKADGSGGSKTDSVAATHPSGLSEGPGPAQEARLDVHAGGDGERAESQAPSAQPEADGARSEDREPAVRSAAVIDGGEGAAEREQRKRQSTLPGIAMRDVEVATGTTDSTGEAAEPAPAEDGRTAGAILPLAKDGSGLVLAIGDVLEITLYERIADQMGPEAEEYEPSVLAALIERTEFSGQYIVQEDGTIFLPLLGPVEVTGLTMEQVVTRITNEAERQLGERLRSSVKITKREPVYVTGAPRPGSFDHVPGMTVLHVMALAGGSEMGEDHWRRLDVSRERERLRKSEERLKRLAARAEVLMAEHEGRSKGSSDLLVEVAGSQADELLEVAARFRAVERARIEAESEGHASVIETLDRELGILRENLEKTEAEVAEFVQRVQSLEELRGRRVITDTHVFDARNQLSTVRHRWQEIVYALARTERALSEARMEKASLALDADLERQKEIKSVLESISEERITQAIVGHLLRGFSDVSAVAEKGDKLEFRIIRRTPQGLEELRAEEKTTVLPGDVLRVIRPPSELGTAVIAW